MSDTPPTSLTLDALTAATTDSGTAFRIRARLQPAGGVGDKVFPPTYAGDKEKPSEFRSRYAYEERFIDGKYKDTVLLDSVASQANRMELALLDARQRGTVGLPLLAVEFPEQLPDLGRISSLEAPHRVYDALLRDSMLGDKAFRESEVGRRLTDASPRDARAMFEHCPTALIFGAWDSTGPRGGLGNKFQRAVVSEVIGIGYVDGTKVRSRLDPVQASSQVGLTVPAGRKDQWTFSGTRPPSDVNHSNIPPSRDTEAGGVTFEYALHTAVLSLPALRKLRFGDWDDEKSNAARVLLAALGLLSITLQRRVGYDFRSRCTLVPEGPAPLELVATDGGTSAFSLSVADAIALLESASKRAGDAGVSWVTEDVVLTPMPKLVQLIEKSREHHAQGNAKD